MFVCEYTLDCVDFEVACVHQDIVTTLCFLALDVRTCGIERNAPFVEKVAAKCSSPEQMVSLKTAALSN